MRLFTQLEKQGMLSFVTEGELARETLKLSRSLEKELVVLAISMILF